MGLIGELKQVVKNASAALTSEALLRIARSGYFRADDIGWITDTYFTQGVGPGTPWAQALSHAHMELPTWFRHDLDPFSLAYAEQQHRLWQLISGVERPYEAAIDEKEHSWGDIDPVRSPGFYGRRDALAVSSASDHLLATAMLLKHCGLKPGDHALEYGAGFGQSALALARLGVNVDTVDISVTFCDYLRRQAEFFQVPLKPFHGSFALNPRPGQKYDLIWFYESFHHCEDFVNVVRQLGDQLAEGGRVILGGEPIVEREYAAVPYPWGIRLHSEVAAVVRRQHWFELGFSEAFLVELFMAAGFVARRVDCESSLFGRLYVFERRPEEINLGQQWLPVALAEQWPAAQADGRWTGAAACWTVDAGSGFVAIEVEIENRHLHAQQVEISYGGKAQGVRLSAGQQLTLRLDRCAGARALEFRCATHVSGLVDRLRGGRTRGRGVVVRRLRYVAVG